MSSGGIELRRKWTATLVIGGFLAGLTLCLIPHFDGHHHHRPGESSTATHPAQACTTSALPTEDQHGTLHPPLAFSFDMARNLFYEGVPLTPPFPPPRA